MADTLQALQWDADAVAANRAAERAAADSLSYARRELELGAISYLGLLNAQQTYQQAVLGLVQAQANRFADTAALFQALGGGWWNRPDDTAPKLEQAQAEAGTTDPQQVNGASRADAEALKK